MHPQGDNAEVLQGCAAMTRRAPAKLYDLLWAKADDPHVQEESVPRLVDAHGQAVRRCLEILAVFLCDEGVIGGDTDAPPNGDGALKAHVATGRLVRVRPFGNEVARGHREILGRAAVWALAIAPT